MVWTSRMRQLLTSHKNIQSVVVNEVIDSHIRHLDSLKSSDISQSVPRPYGTVFANNYLNMGEVKVVGFDLDYTLVSYTEDLQSLIFSLARDILVNTYG